MDQQASAEDFKKAKFHLPQALKTALALFAISGVAVAFVVPMLTENGSTGGPDAFTFGLTAIIITVLTALLFGWVSRLNLGFAKSTLLMAFLFNSIIAFIKVFLSPAALYSIGEFEVGLFQADPNTLAYYLLVGVVIVLLYVLVFRGIYRHQKKRVDNALSTSQVKVKPKRSFSWKIATLVLFVILVLGGIFLALVFGGLNYLDYVFTGAGGSLLACLVIAIVLASGAMKEVGNKSIELRDATLLTTFFWVGISLILIYHVIWIAYMVTLVSIWPFKTYTPK